MNKPLRRIFAALLVSSSATTAMAVDVIDAGPTTVYVGEPGAQLPNGDGANGEQVDVGSVTLNGEDRNAAVFGGNGGNGVNAGNGGGVDPITLTVNAENLADSHEFSVMGGNSGLGSNGNGGNGADITGTINGEAKSVDVTTRGGAGTNGGDSGEITLVVGDATITKMEAHTIGGNGTGGTAGAGQDIHIDVSSNATIGTLNVTSLGGTDAQGQSAQAGNITVVVAGDIGDINLSALCNNCNEAQTSTATVTLADGAKVTGTITNATGANGVLEFTMQVSEIEYQNAAAAFDGIKNSGATSGAIEIAGETYRFENFAELRNLLVNKDAKPNDPVIVTPDPVEPGQPNNPNPSDTFTPAPVQGGSSNNGSNNGSGNNANNGGGQSVRADFCDADKLALTRLADGRVLLSNPKDGDNILGYFNTVNVTSANAFVDTNPNDNWTVEVKGQRDGKMVAYVSQGNSRVTICRPKIL